MALLRLLCLPSTSQFSIKQQFFFSPTPHKPSPNLLSLSTCTSPISLSLTTQTPNFHFFALSSTTQAEAPTTIDTDTPQAQEEEYSKTRLLAQNIPWSLTADEIRPLFEKYGTVVDIELVMYNKNKKRSKGLAFVSMSSEEEALAAFKNLELYEIGGRNMRLGWAKPRKEKPPPPPPKPQPIHNVFVANLPFDARSKDLKEFFNTENAKAVSADVIFLENPRRSAGYGFVSFNTKEEADAAVTAFQGKVFMGRTLRVDKSKKFLRPATKAAIESEDATPASDPKAEEPAS